MDNVDLLAMLKEALRDPDIKDSLKRMVKESDAKPSGPPIDVFEVDDSDIPELERSANKNIKVKDNYRKTSRPEGSLVVKTCGCGRTQSVMLGSPLDSNPFICNKCLVG